MSKIQWISERRKLSELVPLEYNPRKITQRDKEQLKKSLNKFELADPIIINRNNHIIGGHQRYYILLEQEGSDYEVGEANKGYYGLYREASKASWRDCSDRRHSFMHSGKGCREAKFYNDNKRC